MLRLSHPESLLLLVLVPLAAWSATRRRPALVYSSLSLLACSTRPTLRQRLFWLPLLFRAAWLSLLVLAIAGPERAEPTSAQTSPTQSLMLAIDTSGSMGVEIPSPEGPVTRLDRVKRSARVLLDDLAPESTLVGVVGFASRPTLVAPPTMDIGAISELIGAMKVATQDNETNIGDALAVALAGLDATELLPRKILLFSDGAHNVKEALSAGRAARIAEALGVAINVVGVGDDSTAPEDLESLRAIARITGGEFAHAEDLRNLPALVDDLGTAMRRTARVEGYRRWKSLYPLVIAAALVLWIGERSLTRYWLRPSPSDW
ncbi:von Willebrand factor type A domain protein [Planctomycetes bacterium Pan216]|uniref:von Willebrand factor type A domain protein n=1 Tax=Kolteria novifilia TaxID=2527975 RepID=A0A518B5H1_9BACT|nr:von Willebrand factor type A domain protein [Planctomycetes bacterium Pan216]